VCDHVVVLQRGRVVGAGRPADVFRPQLLDAVYDVATRVTATPDGLTHLSFSLPSSPPSLRTKEPA
jgi:iron complex transport system ATP-binding protein